MPAPDARARAIVARLSEGTASSDEVFAAFEELDHLPPDVVRGALEPWTGPAPDLERLDDQVRRAHRLPLRTPRLTVLESVRDADVLDGGELAEQQVCVAGKTWDGQDLDAFERLDGEREDSFAGTLERRVLGENGKALYDVILFGDGAGVFFRAGTTTVLGLIADHLIETTDRPARLALERALGGPPASVEAVQQEQLSLPLTESPVTLVSKAKAEPVVEEAVLDEPIEPEAEPEPEREPAPKKKRASVKKKASAKAAAAAPKKKKKAASAAAPKKKTTTKKAAAKKKKAAARDDG